jgi:hypothetical protein
MSRRHQAVPARVIRPVPRSYTPMSGNGERPDLGAVGA